MNFEKHAARINKAHQLILEEHTGTPDAFADKLKISRSQLYNLIAMLKECEAPIKYNKKMESFCYLKPFDLKLKCSLKIIIEEDSKKIF